MNPMVSYKSYGLLQVFACSVINELTSGVKQEGSKLIKSLWDKKQICHLSQPKQDREGKQTHFGIR